MHEQAVAFRLALNQASDLPAKVSEVINDKFETIKASQDLKSFNNAFEKKHSDSPLHVLSAIRTRKLLGDDKAKLEKEITKLLDLPNVDFTDALQGLETLNSWRSGEVDTFKKAALNKWADVTRLA